MVSGVVWGNITSRLAYLRAQRGTPVFAPLYPPLFPAVAMLAGRYRHLESAPPKGTFPILGWEPQNSPLAFHYMLMGLGQDYQIIFLLSFITTEILLWGIWIISSRLLHFRPIVRHSCRHNRLYCVWYLENIVLSIYYLQMGRRAPAFQIDFSLLLSFEWFLFTGVQGGGVELRFKVKLPIPSNCDVIASFLVSYQTGKGQQ